MATDRILEFLEFVWLTSERSKGNNHLVFVSLDIKWRPHNIFLTYIKKIGRALHW
jgi:hypothetical protein